LLTYINVLLSSNVNKSVNLLNQKGHLATDVAKQQK